MNTDYKDKPPFKSTSVFRSFFYAGQGITSAFLKERNVKIHFAISIIVVILGFTLELSKIEWLFVLFAIGGMFVLELLNTVVERIVDLVTTEFHPLAKEAKDIAAGAVLIYALLSVLVGMLIFIPKIL